MLSTVVEFLFPPTGLALLAVLLLLQTPRRRARPRLAILLLAVLVALSLPAVSEPLLTALDLDDTAAAADLPGPQAPDQTPATPPNSTPGSTPDTASNTSTSTPPSPDAPPGAIVILSADVDRTRNGADIGALTLERERAGAGLARRTGLPVLVTGGIVNLAPPVAEQMARSMQDDFAVPVRWIEPRSATTWENAAFSAPMLRAAGITRVYLVTHAWHMRRAVLAFHRAGIEAVPAAVRIDPWPTLRFGILSPRASSWMKSYFALHEWIGLAYYTWRQ